MIFSEIADVFEEVFPAGVGGDCELVAALVLGMAGVALEPIERDAVTAVHGVEAEPQVHVLLLGETGAFPGFEPAFVHGFDHVRGIAPDMDLRIVPADGLEALDDRQEFHPVVGGEAVAFRDLLLAACAAEDDAEPARAGIAAGGPVGVQEYGRSVLFHRFTKIALSGQLFAFLKEKPYFCMFIDNPCI